jgi:two-component system sensor histidine kinase RegB
MDANEITGITSMEASAIDLDGRIRLGTLVIIRWLAVVGQLGSLLFVHYGLGFQTPIHLTIPAVIISALLNCWLAFKLDQNKRLSEKEAAGQLAFDLLHLSLLLYLTGGLANPFSVLLLAPASVSASVLGKASTKSLIMLSIGAVTALAFTPFPLPWNGEPPKIDMLITGGLWVALSFTLIFIAVYMGRVSSEGRSHARALAATQIALEKEQQVAAVGALAAAAAHELGTPLGSIMLISKEMLSMDDLSDEVRDDLQIIFDETSRCRGILSELREQRKAGDIDHFTAQPLEAIIREAALPHEKRRSIDISYEVESEIGAIKIKQSPALIHALRNIIENAVGFARRKVTIEIFRERDSLISIIKDDGFGFDTAILKSLGEPYVSTRQPTPGRDGGMGLGIFIAKTLLESAGARILFSNVENGRRAGGASVEIEWPLDQFEATDV